MRYVVAMSGCDHAHLKSSITAFEAGTVPTVRDGVHLRQFGARMFDCATCPHGGRTTFMHPGEDHLVDGYFAAEAAQRGEGEIHLALAYLEDIVDRRLERAIHHVLFVAARLPPGPERDTELNFARADYAAAHIVASLVDERVYDCNEWPVFTAWAHALMQAAGQ